MACAQYSPTAPFTQAIIEALRNQNLPPNDWKQVARACLSGGDYLLWKSEFAEQGSQLISIGDRDCRGPAPADPGYSKERWLGDLFKC